MVCQDAFSKVLENNPDINNIIKLNLKSIKNSKRDFNSIKTLKSFKNRDYDLIIDAQGLIKSAIVARFLGKNRVGFVKTQQEKDLQVFFIIKSINILW